MFRTTKLAICGVLATIFCVTANALHLPSKPNPLNALAALDTADNRNKIELIDVKCDKNENGMHVTIQFSESFDGIIYSQGFFNEPKCRYVSAGQSEKSYNFVVPFDGCGSKPSCAICDSVDNILIIQHDEEVQGEYDSARKISCSRTGVEEEKKVYFKPFIVDMLDVVTVPTSNGGVDCWMDVQRGIFPKLTAIGDVIKIGEPLTVLVYLRDSMKEYDLSVRNCWAYDSEDFDDKNTGKVQLSDASGCSTKKKLFSSWQKTTETGSSDATMLLHNTLRAFKFPDESQVYLKCDIEICRGNCAEAICDPDEIPAVNCTLNPLNSKCINEQLMPRPGPPSNSVDLLPKSVNAPGPKRPSIASATERFGSYISSTLYEQDTETTTYRDITTTIQTATDAFCKLNPKHKRCNQRITDDIDSNAEILTPEPLSPFATVKYQPTTIPSNSIDELPTTTEILRDVEPPLICKGDNLDPRCPNPTPTNTPPTYLPAKIESSTLPFEFTTKFPSTDSPNTNPPKIKQPTTKQPIAKQSITTKQPITKKPTKKFFICVPGSNDLNCDFEATKPTTIETTTAIPTQNQFEFTTKKPSVSSRNQFVSTTKQPVIPNQNQFAFTTKKPEKSICFIGSKSPECKKLSPELNVRPKVSTTVKPTRTTAVPQRAFSTTFAPIVTKKSTTKKSFRPIEPVASEIPVFVVPACYPGDPDCPKPNDSKKKPQITTKKPFVRFTTTTRSPATATDRTVSPSTTRGPICYPGALDPRCSKTTTTKLIIPSVGTTPEITSEIQTTTTFKPLTNFIQGSKGLTTKKPIPAFTTTLRTTKTAYSSTARAPVCYPGALDPRCSKSTTAKPSVPSIGTTPETATAGSISTTLKPIVISRLAPNCYVGSTDPRCVQTTKKTAPITFSTTTKLPVASTRPPICYPGALDPRCRQQTTTTTTTQRIKIETKNLISTTSKPVVSSTTQAPPKCYPGSLDIRCKPSKLVVPLNCDSGEPLDPRCPNPTPTAQPATYLPPFTGTDYITTKSPLFTTKAPIATTKSPLFTTKLPIFSTKSGFVTTKSPIFTTKLPLFTTKSAVVSTTLPTFTSKFPIFTTTSPTIIPKSPLFTTKSPIFSTKSPLDTTNSPIYTTKFAFTTTTPPIYTTKSQIFTTKTPTITTKLPQYTTKLAVPTSKFPAFSTKLPASTRFECTPNSIDPRCNQFSSTKNVPIGFKPGFKSTTPFASKPTGQPVITPKTPFISTTRKQPLFSSTSSPLSTTQKSVFTSTTKRPASVPTFSTGRIISSPRPFSPRTPTPKTTTENVLCYPGSTIEGCKTSFTTPSFCYPGSKDKRCPQLPPSFSTQQPATYLPPYPGIDARSNPDIEAQLNRVKRAAFVEHQEKNEIVKFSLSFKPFSLS